ncbi:MAG: competence/damage-inducible protein A [Planctomycetes bacterium]|nr:competence/damage-inducible protein A [Planctomycetota bacterium]
MGDEHIKKAALVSIGNELLNGKTVDTNAAYIAGRLRTISLPVVSVHTAPDEQPAIERTLALAAREADIVVATGGLGPTDDDVTRQAFAGFLGVELVLRPELLEKLKEFFDRRGIEMPARNSIQACVPQGASAIENNMGTAPGIWAWKDGKRLFALPGVPAEMRHMFDTQVLPELRPLVGGQAIAVRRLKCFGAGESKVAERIGDAMERGRNPLVNCTVHAGIISLEVVASAADRPEAEKMAEREECSLRTALGQLVYGTNDQTLAEVVGEALVRTGQTLAVAESCTGGLLAELITDIPGSSRYFTYGWVTYSNEAKCTELEVPREMIDMHGAVSEQVARAMAQGARRKAGTDYAVAITGIAGPGGGSEQKPVGLVYIAVDNRDGTDTSRYIFSFDRSSVRLRAAQTALNTLRLKLNLTGPVPI